MRETTTHQSFYAGRLLRCGYGTSKDVYEVPETAEDHREMAMHLLDTAEGGDTENRLRAARVHAMLALTAPEADGVPKAVVNQIEDESDG